MLTLTPPDLQHINRTPPVGSGVNCRFYLIGDNGLKLYRSLDTAQYTYDAQKKAYDAGIAPRLLSDVITIETDDGNRYGYFTEVVKTLAADIVKKKIAESPKRPCHKYCPADCEGHPELEWCEASEKVEDEYNFGEVICLMEALELETSDLHEYNWGVIDGRPVVIDFAGCGHD